MIIATTLNHLNCARRHIATPDLLKLKSRWYDTMLQKWFCVLSERTQPRASFVTYRAASMARKYHTLEDANAPDWVPAWLKVPAFIKG